MTDTAASRTAGLERALARNSLNYDLQPYAAHAFAQTAPARLAGVARLFGLMPPPVAGARILELGCSSGGNIIPLAERYPDADVHGVDISRVQISAGRARVAELGLGNVHLHCQSFTEVGDLGRFDYVIAHGVYSWLPPAVREAMMALIGRLLADDGVAYVSYNVLPGWRVPQALRDALLLTVPMDAPAALKVERAREALRFLADATDKDSVYGAGIREWATRLADLPDDYVGHEFLEDINAPCTVLDFINAADEQGLTYLGESDIAPMVADNRDPDLAERLRAMTGNQVAGMEQMMDIITGRTFRQSLLVRHAAAAGITRDLTPARLESLHFVTDGTLKGSGSDDEGEDDADDTLFTAIDGAGRTVTAGSAGTTRALRHLIGRYPASFDLASLQAAAGEEAAEEVGETLFRMLLAGMVTPLSEPVEPVLELGDTPRATASARADAAAGATSTANLRHERVLLDAAAGVVLPLLDGHTDTAALTAALVDAAAAGRVTIARDGTPLTDRAELEEVAAPMVPRVLEGIRRAGLLVG